MVDYMQKGGPLMSLILLCSAAAVAVFVERLLYYHRASINVEELLQGLSTLIRSRNFAEARVQRHASPIPVTPLLQAALHRPHFPPPTPLCLLPPPPPLEVPPP